jgi:autonomous glycyl radical cofactor GrcA
MLRIHPAVLLAYKKHAESMRGALEDASNHVHKQPFSLIESTHFFSRFSSYAVSQQRKPRTGRGHVEIEIEVEIEE